jgi:hypothetical protein
MDLHPTPWLVTLFCCACAGSSAGGGAAEPSTSPEAAGPRSPGDLAGAKVYDSKGQAQACAEPRPDCPKTKPDADFLDQCRLRGYQTRRCGCDTLCSGNVATKRPHYDAAGKARDCAPETEGCKPPETSAAFQDACNEAQHRLVVCGCEWLCDGPITK